MWMINSPVRRSLGRSSLRGFILLALLAARSALAANPVDFDIPAEDAMAALQRFARQSGIQVFAPAEILRGVRTHAVKGSYLPEEALAKMLEGSDLVPSSVDGGKTVTLTAPSTNSTSKSLPQVEEVIVTANKRVENLREVSGSVTAITGREMDRLGAQSFSDYLTRVPGVQFNAAVPGLSYITIRGVSTTTSTDTGQAATGVYINDIPLTDPFNSTGVPDVDTFDVDRVEVLRGPQATMFGSATLGGAVNYIAARARSDEFSGRLESSLSNTSHANDPGYTAKGMVNVPLIQDRLAVRLVGTYRDLPGYLDNIGVGRDHSNHMAVSGGRVSIEWQASERLRVSGLSLYSQTRYDDAFNASPILGELVRSTALLEPFKSEILINSLSANAELGFAALTLSAAHSHKNYHNTSDYTPSFGPVFGGLAPPIALRADRASSGNTFELRLTSPSGLRLEWLAGLSRTKTQMELPLHSGFPGAAGLIQTLFGDSQGPGFGAAAAPDDQFIQYHLNVDGTETAAFGEATYHFTDAWRVTAGGRAFRTQVDNTTTQGGLFNFFSTGEFSSSSGASSKQNGFSPKVSVTYEPRPDSLYYALFSRGFRFGGPNAIPQTSQYPSPASFGSDSLSNFELGTRQSFFDRRLSIDATVFYIDWHNIQVGLIRGDNLAYADNVGRARNVGLDLATTWLVTSRFNVQFTAGYLDAKLRDDVPDAGFHKGDSLPGASKWRLASTLQYQWETALRPSLLLSHRYLSSAVSELGDTPPRQGNYHLVDMRGRLTLGDWVVEAYVENLGDVRGVTVGETSRGGVRDYYVMPRTSGMRATWDF
jgi:outer membrane receptor protein involved in Fe transport